MMPLASMIAPEPRDWALRRERGAPKKKSSKMDGRRLRICSAEMLTTAGETFSTTSTTSLFRVESGEAVTRGEISRRIAASGFFTVCTTPWRRSLLPDSGTKEKPRLEAGRNRGMCRLLRLTALRVLALDVDRLRRVPAGDLDRPGLGVLPLGELDLEQSIDETGLNPFAVDVVRQTEAPDEAAVGTLDAVESLIVRFLFEAPLTG